MESGFSSFVRVFVISFDYLDLLTTYSIFFLNRLVRFWSHHLVVQREIAPLLTQLTEVRSYYAKLSPSAVKPGVSRHQKVGDICALEKQEFIVQNVDG